MRFDDRLLTVLNQPAGDRHDTAVRWRQLVDLVARAGPNSASPIVAQALESIRAEAANVDEPLRAAAARAVAALPLPLGLLECFAADRLAVSAPVLAAASLDRGRVQAGAGGLLHGVPILIKDNIGTGDAMETTAGSLALAAAGAATLWLAIAADMGASLLVTFNGLRLLSRPDETRTLARRASEGDCRPT